MNYDLVAVYSNGSKVYKELNSNTLSYKEYCEKTFELFFISLQNNVTIEELYIQSSVNRTDFYITIFKKSENAGNSVKIENEV